MYGFSFFVGGSWHGSTVFFASEMESAVIRENGTNGTFFNYITFLYRPM